MRESDLIWNRACAGGGATPKIGDRAICNLLRAHGLAMNGGVLHAVECLTPLELSYAAEGYHFFGVDSVAKLLVRVREVLSTGKDLEVEEPALDGEYAGLIPDDSFLFGLFEQHYDSHPEDFAPL